MAPVRTTLFALLALAATAIGARAQDATPPPAAPKPDDTPTEGELVGGFVAQVNKHLITRRDVEERVGSLRSLADPEKAAAVWRDALRKIILEQLATDAAHEADIHVDEKYVDQEMKAQIEKAGGRDTFLSVLDRTGKTEQQYRDDIEKELLVYTFYRTSLGSYSDKNKKVRPDVDLEPTVTEMRAYYTANEAAFITPAKARLRQIYLRNANFASEDACYAHMVELRERILKGETFEDVAKAESNDSLTRAEGGDLGEIPLEGGPYQKFVTDFAASAKSGDLSEIERPKFGCYLFQLVSKSERRVGTFDDPAIQEKIVKEIKQQKQSVLLSDLQERLLREAYIYCPEMPELNRGRRK
jgi:parvulin-like peptidyl-prolyl isomerase